MSSTTRSNHPASASAAFRSPRAACWLTTGLALAVATLAAHAGGSSYGIEPGARDIAGKVAEWPAPTPQFARDPTFEERGLPANTIRTACSSTSTAWPG